MNSFQLRQKFLDFFESKDHKKLPPASLIPENDPSVLFTTAGMQQFKPYYTNSENVPAKNVVTCQPCIRTSDIEEIGDDTHLTFFEMLGNFSFGGYFKKEAIEMAIEFLDSLNIDKEKIWCSIFQGDDKNPRDDESAQILESMQIKYKEFPREDCFWGPTGDEGPCGPAVEVYIDDVEVWTLVFNEYYVKDGAFSPLETKGIDTGMGLERMLVKINNVENVFHTDLFGLPCKKLYELLKIEDPINERIILDHIKAAVFAINDGILPANKDAGYIVRRLIRRAVIKAKKLGINENFTTVLAKEVFNTYKDVYDFKTEIIEEELTKEESKFRNTLELGLKEFEKVKNDLDGKIAFDLHQSYGFPLEMTEELAEENGIEIEKSQFEQAFKSHQDLSRTASAGMFKGGLAGGGEQEIKYHTATHLLLASLKKVLGEDIHQKGSNITAERLRFDFSYPDKLTDEQLKQVEDIVNQKIREDLPVKMEEMSLEDAKNCGAVGEFGQKYGFKVKVYFMGDFSKEICGGPHVEKIGVLGHFKIIKEESSSAGVRRVKATLTPLQERVE